VLDDIHFPAKRVAIAELGFGGDEDSTRNEECEAKE